ncbi:MAG TPA: AMP-binding protein [Azospira sp.]|nr:AMP-binding protein [Azospira sp.]
MIQRTVPAATAPYNRTLMKPAASAPATLAGMLAAYAGATPDAPAMFYAGETHTYARLAEATARRAAHLALQLSAHLSTPPAEPCAGPHPAALTPIALAADAGAGDLALTLLACNWAGHAFLPLAADGGEGLPGAGDDLPAGSLRLSRAPEAGDERLPQPAPARAGATALAIATSGREGRPKRVLLGDAALAAAAAASATRLPLAAGDVWLDCLPLNHIGGLSIFWRCFAAGAAVRLHDGFAAEAVWAAISAIPAIPATPDLAAGERPVSHVSLVPAMLARLLDAAGDAPPPPTLRGVLIGGAALSRPLWQRARAAGWPLYISYGMSETAAQIATLPPTDDWQEGLVGTPLPGMEVRIDDDGRIRVRGPQLMQGYLDSAEAAAAEPTDASTQAPTAPPLVDGWLRTGDLGRLDDAGRLHVLGRGDDVLVSGGVNIHPLDVESRLAACPGVADVAVTATPDPVWGDLVTALVVGSADPAAVEAWSRAHLPARLRPRRTLAVAALPRNALGKLERRRLPELLAGLAR